MNTTSTSVNAQGLSRGTRATLIIGTCAVALVAGFAAMPDYADRADAIGYALRITARIAFAFLMLAYIAGPWAVFTRQRWLVRNRRYLGLAMALAHTVHFGAVVAYLNLPASELEVVTLVFGGGAFVLMWLMAATSNDVSIRRLGKNWKRLHTVGLHYVWGVFMFTWLGAAGEAMPAVYIVMLGAGMAGLLLRVAAFWTQRARRTA